MASGKAPIRPGKEPMRDILFPLAPIPGTNTDIDSWGGDPSLVTHHGIFCKGPLCSEKTEPIRGIRYKCSRCPNIDFDDTCVRDPDNSHPRDHTFWSCGGEVVFEDRNNMSKEELKEVTDLAGDIPEEYLVVPQQNHVNGPNGGARTDAMNLQQLGEHLFGINSHISDDQLIVHWKNGIPAARLINLLPGSPEDVLHCYFISTRLDEPDSYDALCCDWIPGDPNTQPGIANGSDLNLPAVIYVGEQCTVIKKSTADALKALRSTKDIIKLWVEELCVQNQHPEFKAFQERSTSLIHMCAERSIVWTGNEDEHTNAAFTLIEMLSHLCKREDSSLPSPSDIEKDGELEQLDLLPVGSDAWQSLLRFLPPHLFVQGWMLHDVAFASNPIVQCGDYKLEWWKVARVRDMLAQPLWMNLDWRLPGYDDSGFEDQLL